MRQITGHHDGHGLAEQIEVVADDLGPGGASHQYAASIGGVEVMRVQFQRGARDELGSVLGVIDGVLLAIIVDRMACFGVGPWPSVQGLTVLGMCEDAIAELRARADDRAARGVLGKERP